MRAQDNHQLWHGRHIASSHGGSFPITPVDLAMGLYSATSKISDEQIVRVGDDLFRRLLLTWDRSGEPDQQGIMQAKVESRDVSSFYVKTDYLNLGSGPGMKFCASTVLKQNDVVMLLNECHTPWL